LSYFIYVFFFNKSPLSHFGVCQSISEFI
jgi:hypothetical protein